LSNQWKYKFGNNRDWAKTDYNDENWETINPIFISFNNKTEHQIAVKYINNGIKSFHKAGFYGGFHLVISEVDNIKNKLKEKRKTTITQIFFLYFLLHLE